MNENKKNQLLEYALTWHGRKPYRKPRFKLKGIKRVKSFHFDINDLRKRLEKSRKCKEIKEYEIK